MGTKIICIAALLLFSICGYAQKYKLVKESILQLENGNIRKDYAYTGKNSRGLTLKVYHINDQEGKRLERFLEVSDKYSGKKDTQKHVYSYDNEGKIECVSLTRWDNNTSKWSNISEVSRHTYDSEGNLTAIKQFEINTENLYFTQNLE